LGKGTGLRASVVSQNTQAGCAVEPASQGNQTDDRRWDSELQRWVYGIEVSDALNDAQTAIEEYYNGDRDWAERWLVRAYEANQKDG
jgi:hypothetical protein